MKNILALCDFSAPSREAFNVAVEIATKSRGQVTLLNVLSLPVVYDALHEGGSLESPAILNQLQHDSENTLKAMSASLPDGAPKVHTEVRIGEVLAEAREVVNMRGIDLVVMGKTGNSRLLEFLIGSTTEKAVRHMPVPVLAVDSADFVSSIKHILVPCSLGLDQKHFMDKVLVLQDFFKSTLHLIHVNTPTHFKRDADAYAAMNEFARHYHLTNYQTHFVNDYTEEAGIIAFATDQKTDLIAMGTHARKGLSHLFNSSITEDLVNHFHGAVWTCPLKS